MRPITDEWISAVGDEESCRVVLRDGVASLVVQDDDSVSIVELNLAGIGDLIRALMRVRDELLGSK